MTRLKKSKNIKTINGVKFYQRWTVLNVEIEIIDLIRSYATSNDVTIRRALSEMIREAASNDFKSS